jgi:hypothetical protein
MILPTGLYHIIIQRLIEVESIDSLSQVLTNLFRMILSDDFLLAQDTNQLMPHSSNVLQLNPVSGHVLNSFKIFLDTLCPAMAVIPTSYTYKQYRGHDIVHHQDLADFVSIKSVLHISINFNITICQPTTITFTMTTATKEDDGQ